MSALSSFVDGLIAATKTAEEQALLPAIATAAENIAANPSIANGVAQLNVLLAEAIAAQGKVAQTDLQYIATQAAALAQSVVTPAPSAK